MKYKLLCVDMDGTLLDSNKKIGKRTVDAVSRASAKGVHVVICTGRLFTSADYYADLLGVKAPIVSANGAFIREKDRNEVIYKSTLGKQNCRRILSVLKKYGICPNFHSPKTIFTDDVDSPYSRYMKLDSKTPENENIEFCVIKDWEEVFSEYEEEIVKCITIHEDIDRIKAAKEEMLTFKEFEVVSSFTNNFEVMNSGVSKGRAVEILSAYYNIKREEIICIGDNENDLSMIHYAGLGVAMGNAEQSVKEIADYVTASNNEDGVAQVIEQFILVEK
jgi:Cof subfamily protein (haloacid dehalogenase superfamily)